MLEAALAEITGMDAVTLQPAAGAHGELTGILLIRALLAVAGQPAQEDPDSGFGARHQSGDGGHRRLHGREHQVRTSAAWWMWRRWPRAVNEDVAALMVTNPNTLGVFEQDIVRVAGILHAKGAQLYMDGANMNALVGVARPGDFGVDVMHLNLHKTFSTPHGGGGPGSGPVAVKKHLEPFLPVPRLAAAGRALDLRLRPAAVDRPRARPSTGTSASLVRALAYILAHGGEGLRKATMDAVLNANYIRKKLEPYYDLPHTAPTMHECVFSDARQAARGVQTGDIAKRLIDYGFHPYTVSFPLIVHGAHDDRADRDREQARAGPLRRRHDLDRQGGRGRTPSWC